MLSLWNVVQNINKEKRAWMTTRKQSREDKEKIMYKLTYKWIRINNKNKVTTGEDYVFVSSPLSALEMIMRWNIMPTLPLPGPKWSYAPLKIENAGF